MSTEKEKEATVKLNVADGEPKEFNIRHAERILAHQKKRKRDDWKISEGQNFILNENGSIVAGSAPGKDKKTKE